MSYEISVPTPFNDVSELAESFYQRVDEERLMLPAGQSVPEGEWVQFAVTLADGSAALQGQGRVTTSLDNGEERAPEHRFDVVMDSLQLDEMAQIYFERILQVRAAYAGDEPQTGETQVPEEHAAYAQAQADAAPDETQTHMEGDAGLEAGPGAGDYGAGDYGAGDYGAGDPAARDPGAYGDAGASRVDPAAVDPAGIAATNAAEPVAAVDPGEVADLDAEVDLGFDASRADPEAVDPHALEAEAYVEPMAAEVDPGTAGAYAEAEPLAEEDGFGAEATRAVAFDEIEGAPEPELLDSGLVEAVDEPPPEGEPDTADLLEDELSAGLEAAVEPAPPSASPGPAPALQVPTESRIYALPEPRPPGPLPAPHQAHHEEHGGRGVLTRRLLHATWSPRPEARPEPSPSSGHFVYAQGAGLPQPAAPPRPEIDPALRVAPAPRPTDAFVAPSAATATAADAAQDVAPELAYAAEAYDDEPPTQDVYEEAAYEAGPADRSPAYERGAPDLPEAEPEQAYAEPGAVEHEAGHVDADDGEEAAAYALEVGDDGEDVALQVEAGEGEYAAAAEVAAVDGGSHAELVEAGYEPRVGEATHQVDVSGLPDDIPLTGDETMQVELPEEEPG